MPPSTSQHRATPQPPDVSRALTPELRVDPPHPHGLSRHQEPLEDSQEVDLSTADLETLPDWQRRQIHQLARLLRERQVDLDRREAELNARIADFESQQRSAALALAEQLASPAPSNRPAAETPSPAVPPTATRTIEQTIRSWRRKWRGQMPDSPPPQESTDGVAVRLEKLSEAETQLAQQWALLKNARTLQALREKEFAGYAQKVERESEQSRAQQHQWLEQEQEQIARQQEDLAQREEALAQSQLQLECALEGLYQIRDELETAWEEIRVRVPSSLRRRLDQQVEQPLSRTAQAAAARREAAKQEIRQLLAQLEQLKLDIQEDQIRLEDEFQRQEAALRRAKRELQDRESQVRAQLAQLRSEHEALCESKRELLKERYRELTQNLVPKVA